MSPSGPEPADGPTIPTEEEIDALPRSAREAFYTRCARRSPLYSKLWLAALDQIDGVPDNATAALIEALAVGHTSTSMAKLPALANVANFSYKFLYATITRADDKVLAAHAFTAYNRTTYPTPADAANAVRAAMRRDYEMLKTAAKAEEWTDDTPVPPDFFGPLWPQGNPA